MDLKRRLEKPRVRSEIGWVLAHRATQFVVMFASVKVLTQLLPQAEFGVFKLTENLLLLLSFIFTEPVLQAQRRYFHAASDESALAASVSSSLRLHVQLSLALFVIFLFSARWLGPWLDIPPMLCVLAAGLFIVNRVRNLGLALLEIERLRKTFAQQHLGFELSVISLIAGVLYVVGERFRSATTVVIVYVAVSAPFCVVAMKRYWGLVKQGWGKLNTDYRQLLITFGLPSAALQSFQWLLTFADRFIIADELGQTAVGLYIGVRQICSAPFTLAVQASMMLIGVAYQQIGDQSDPNKVWYAYRTLLLGVMVYASFGIVAVFGYLAIGPDLVVLLTSEKYRTDRLMIVLLAIGQWLLSFGLVLQVFYYVSTRMKLLIVVRIVLGALGVGLYWWLIKEYGLIGGAYGSVIAGGVSVIGLICVPGGIISIIRAARRAKMSEDKTRTPDNASST